MSGASDKIIRLIRYKNALRRLASLGMKKVISDNLAEIIGISSSQVRIDFSKHMISGNKRGGYDIDDILEKLEKILQSEEVQKIILVGCGHLGQAFLNYKGFEKENIKIVAGFDLRPLKFNLGIEMFSMEALQEYIQQHQIKISILAVPAATATVVADHLMEYGIRGILNYSSITIHPLPGCIVKNVDLSLVLEQLIYQVQELPS